MTKRIKGISWKNTAAVAGTSLVALALVDTAWQWKGSGSGVSPHISGNSAPAFLMVGIIIGMLLGIGMAFAYFIWKEKKINSQPDELTQLLDELSKEEALYIDDNYEVNEEKGDALEPWERPTDWWKSDEE